MIKERRVKPVQKGLQIKKVVINKLVKLETTVMFTNTTLLYHCISAASCSSLRKATSCKSHQHNYLIISALSVYLTISKFSYLRAKTCKSKHTEKKKV